MLPKHLFLHIQSLFIQVVWEESEKLLREEGCRVKGECGEQKVLAPGKLYLVYSCVS